MAEIIKGTTVCPQCKAQLQLEARLTFASIPKSSSPPSEAGSELGQLLSQIDDSSLSGQVAVFVASTRERFEQYGEKTRMSEKQMAWLRKIASGETGNDW